MTVIPTAGNSYSLPNIFRAATVCYVQNVTKTVGGNVYARRFEAGFTSVKAFAAALNWPPSRVTALERDYAENPDPPRLQHVAAVLTEAGVKTEWRDFYEGVKDFAGKSLEAGGTPEEERSKKDVTTVRPRRYIERPNRSTRVGSSRGARSATQNTSDRGDHFTSATFSAHKLREDPKAFGAVLLEKITDFKAGRKRVVDDLAEIIAAIDLIGSALFGGSVTVSPAERDRSDQSVRSPGKSARGKAPRKAS